METVVHDSRRVLLFKQTRYSNHTLTYNFRKKPILYNKENIGFLTLEMSRNRIPLFRLLVRIILFLALINQSDNGFFEVSVDQTRILRDLQVLGGFRDILASLLLLGLFSNECYRGAWPPAKKRCRCTQASWDSD